MPSVQQYPVNPMGHIHVKVGEPFRIHEDLDLGIRSPADLLSYLRAMKSPPGVSEKDLSILWTGVPFEDLVSKMLVLPDGAFSIEHELPDYCMMNSAMELIDYPIHILVPTRSSVKPFIIEYQYIYRNSGKSAIIRADRYHIHVSESAGKPL